MEEDRSGSCDEYNTCNAHKEEFKITIVNKYTIINKLCFLSFQKVDIHYMQTYSKYMGDIYPPLFSSGVT